MPISESDLQKFITNDKHRSLLYELLRDFVPLALLLPDARNNPQMMDVHIKVKSDTGINDVATNTDYWMQEQIKKKLVANNPSWQFWGEEGLDNVKSLDKSKKYLLILDPIEGTNNFIAGKDDQWGSVLALVDLVTEEPIIGIVAHPTEKKFYFGVKGDGSYTLETNNKSPRYLITEMKQEPERTEFTYNNSPHFEPSLVRQVQEFCNQGEVMHDPNSHDPGSFEASVKFVRNGHEVEFVDPESGALEAIRYRGTLYFKTSNEMAAVFVIMKELGGVVTDFEGNGWHLGINTLIVARNQSDYDFLLKLKVQTV